MSLSAPRTALALSVPALALSVLALALTGCALQQTASTPIETASSETLTGHLHGGQQPVSGASVRVVSIGSSGYGSAGALLSAATTDANGNFSMPAYTCPQANTPVYIVATGGNPGLSAGTSNPALALAAALGTCGTAQSQTVEINEVTTVAAAYAMAQFASTGGGLPAFGGPSRTNGSVVQYSIGLTNAVNFSAPLLVNTSLGMANVSTAVTILPTAKINSLANTVAACVNTDGTGSSCAQLFSGTTPPGSNPAVPTNTLRALVNMALYPTQNVGGLFNLAASTAPFAGLSSAPSDFTLAAAFTSPAGSSAATNNVSFSNFAVDALGNPWLPNGQSGALEFGLATAEFAGPYNASSAVSNANQIAIDMNNNLWIMGNTGTSFGSTSTLNPAALTTIYAGVPHGAYTAEAVPYTIAIGPAGELRYGYYNYTYGGYGLGSRAVGATSNTSLAALTGAPFSQNQDLGDTGFLTLNTASNTYSEFVAANNAERLTSTLSSSHPGQLAQAKNGDTLYPLADLNEVCHYNSTCSPAGFAGFNGPTGLATDGNGVQWVVNSGNASVSSFIPGTTATADVAGSIFTLGSTLLPSPSALVIDQSGNVWINNPKTVPTVLTEIIGAAAPTIQPIAAQYQTATGALVGSRPTF